jgi:glyoxylase-like metal-dependent hydrolase (beta-lactamase superfamily II)
METHVHADHITAASYLKKETGAKIVYSNESEVDRADIKTTDGDKLQLGETEIISLSTPGHTNCSVCYHLDGSVFTGDTLFIRGCGRTDFQKGSSEKLFDSIREKLFTLPDSTIVYPGHDYKGMIYSNIREEKEHNPRIKMDISRDGFIQIMDNLNLPHPKKIDVAVPANLKAGATGA